MLRLSLQLCLREYRAAPWRFLFVWAAIATGTGILGGIQDLSISFRQALKKQSRDWIAADVAARTNAFPTGGQMARIQALGDDWTIVTETVGMAGSRLAGFQTVAVKAVDPEKYPFYGRLLLNGHASLKTALAPDAAVVSPVIEERLKSHPGLPLRLGEAQFRIAATIQSEPDRFAVMPLHLPRVILTREAFDRTGLVRFGGRATHRILLRLRPGMSPQASESLLRELFPDGEVLDSSTNDPDLMETLGQASGYCALLAMVGLLVASAGVAVVMHSHLRSEVHSIAVMKTLGGRSRQVIALYGVQVMLLAFAGSLTGILLGHAVQALLLVWFDAYVPFPIEPVWYWQTDLQTISAGLLMPLAATTPVLSHVVGIRPMQVWRGDWETGRFPVSVAILSLLAFLLYGWWVQGSWKIALGLCGALTLVLGAALLCSWAMLGLLRRLSAWSLPVSWKHGLANLHRPGNYSILVLAAMVAASTFLAASNLLETTLAADWETRSPFRGYNLFLMNVTPREKASLERDLAATGALEAPPQFAAFSRVRFGARDLLATSAAAKPASLEVVAGKWWTDQDSRPLAAVHYALARRLKVSVGQTIRLICGGREMQCTVAALHRSHGPNAMAYDFTLNPAAVRDLPFIFNGAAKATPARLTEIEAQIIEAHPGIVVLNANEALSYVRYAADRVALMVRSLAAFTLAGGVFILTIGITSTSLKRMHETAVFRTLGATGGKLLRVTAVEFAALGLFAGTTGVIFGTMAANAALRLLFDSPPAWPGWVASALLIGVAAVASTVAGWLACLPILRRKPLVVLRLNA